jgi:5-formyltetrahydrofolate cyclo-ligase
VTIAEEKAAARRLARQRRALAFSGRGGDTAAHLIAAIRSHAGRILAGYMPMRTEIDPLPAMAAHRGPVCVPVVRGPGQALAFRAWQPDAAMVAGAFSAPVPATGAWLAPEVLIVPLLAFDRRGYRLGYGGGYYDRTLADLRAGGGALAIGFGFAAQEMDRVPIEATDQPLDLIVTERSMVRPQAGG